MAKTVTAVYEGGVLRPLEPLDLEERQRVTVTVTAEEDEVIDREYHRHLEEMDIPEVNLEDLRGRLSKIPGSLAEDFSAEREERF